MGFRDEARHSVLSTVPPKLFAACVHHALVNFPRGRVLTASRKLQYGIFPLSFSSRCFLTSMRFLLGYTSYLGIRAISLDFRTFADFRVSFLLLISCLIPLWIENILNHFSSLGFVEISCMAQKIGDVGKCSVCA